MEKIAGMCDDPIALGVRMSPTPVMETTPAPALQ
jgi:hypothetical protein